MSKKCPGTSVCCTKHWKKDNNIAMWCSVSTWKPWKTVKRSIAVPVVKVKWTCCTWLKGRLAGKSADRREWKREWGSHGRAVWPVSSHRTVSIATARKSSRKRINNKNVQLASAIYVASTVNAFGISVLMTLSCRSAIFNAGMSMAPSRNKKVLLQFLPEYTFI